MSRGVRTQLDWPDAKAAAALCEGGVCLYRPKRGLGITDEWVATNITPAIRASFGQGVAAILGKALLWSCCYDPSVADLVPPDIRQRAISAFITHNVGLGDNRLTDGTNPIERIGVYPSEVNGNVSLDQVEDEEGQDGSARARTAAQWRVSIYARTASMSRSVTEIQNQHRSDMMEIKRRLRKLEQMVHTLVSRPATPYPTAAGMLRGPALLVRPGIPPPTKPPLLSRNPRTLSLLWDEWQVGLNGHKPASQFTDSERGGENKNRYTFRKPFWRCMCRLIRNGLDKATAIQRIEQTYGVMSLTNTLRAMRQHEGPNKDGHHALRV